MPGVTFVPFPYPARGPIYDPDRCAAWCEEQVAVALRQQTSPQETCAILVEPILVNEMDEREINIAIYIDCHIG